MRKTTNPWTLRKTLVAPLAILAASASAADPPRATDAAVRGQRMFTCAHSFHVFVYRLVADMAKSAGIADHRPAGLSRIGGSRVIQHWDVPDEANEAKAALRAGKVDVLTLSPIWIVPPEDLQAVQRVPGDPREIVWLPDEGIGKFAALGLEHNPDIRITVQEFWLPNDEYVPVYPLQTKKLVDHDATDLAMLRKAQARYDRDVENCIRAVNKTLGKDVLFVVPVGQAAIALRERIVAGRAPGLKTQWDLFRDTWGHAQLPLQVLSAYCHYAVIYRRNPAGLPLPADLAMYQRIPVAGLPVVGSRLPPDARARVEQPTPDELQKLNCLLQELAWDAVRRHPLTGLTAGDRTIP